MDLYGILIITIIVLACSIIGMIINRSADRRKMFKLECDLEDCQDKLEIATALCEGYKTAIDDHARLVDEFTNKELEADNG